MLTQCTSHIQCLKLSPYKISPVANLHVRRSLDRSKVCEQLKQWLVNHVDRLLGDGVECRDGFGICFEGPLRNDEFRKLRGNIHI